VVELANNPRVARSTLVVRRPFAFPEGYTTVEIEALKREGKIVEKVVDFEKLEEVSERKSLQPLCFPLACALTLGPPWTFATRFRN
jgi:hypothetical protein